MAYTEAELIGQLEKDLVRPGELYVKDYIQEGGAASDTGRSYEDIISTYLVSHAEALKMTDTNWGMVHTAIGKTSERGSRMAQKLLSEKDFFHAIPLDGDVRLTDGTMAEIGYFDFMTLDKEGKSLTLFEIRPYPEKEKPLSRLLRCWSLKASLNKALLLQRLGMEKLPRISIVTLITGGGSDHFTPAGRQPVSLPLKQLGGMLGVFCLYLFHGLYGVPVSGAQAPAQMTRAELLSLLEKDAKHPELLYQKDYINRFGLTSDTKEPYAAVAASWLTGHRDLWMGVAHGLYRLVEGNRVSIMMKDPDLQRIRKQRVFPPFGEVLPVALVLLGNRSQELGRPSMLLYDGNPSGVGTYSLVRALERVDPSDSLLRSVLRAFTHLVLVDRKKLMADLRLPEETTMEVRLVVGKGMQYDLFLRDLPFVEPLMKAMGIGLITMGEGYEAMY